MSSSSALNLSDYTTVWSDNFASDTSLDSSLFPVAWGDADEFSFSSAGLTLTSDGNSAGFMNADASATDGTGYGLYSATFSMPAGQDGGYVCLWPSTNVWPGPEIDLGEQLNGTAFLTVHWEGAGDTNQYQSFDINANIADPTTVAVNWEASGLTFYVNGQEVVSYAAGGAVPVPLDAADGGENESFGVGNVGAAGASITVLDMSYSSYNGGSTSPTPTPTPTPAPTPTPTPTGTITLSAPGTVQAASAGASVNVTETVSAPGLTSIYEAVFTSANVAEENWTAVSLNASGTGTFTAHFEQSGDYVVAVNSTSDETIEGWSSPVTITSAATSITVATSGGTSTALAAISSGSESFLGGAVTETVGSGVDTIVATPGGGIASADLQDTTGASFLLKGFAAVTASVSGATSATLTIKGVETATVTLGTGNYTAIVAAPINTATVRFTGGSGADQMTFLGTGTASFTAGSGADVIHGGSGSSSVTFGTGTATVWGGTGGADSYDFQSGDGLETIKNFSVGRGDTLTVASSLQASLQETKVAGGTLLAFGSSSHAILLSGLSSFNTSLIHWS